MGVVTVSASYGALSRGDATQARHDHLVLDTTGIPWETAADLVVIAAAPA